ncbi:hypothetical protein K6Q96_06740 [Grimontia kaedaensis]|uniref:Uncharacterized protein n=1 Tax=Grimontia kaedaensis TaxID=2872157 RepID=A0ABY4WXH5_9GAMM|nr:hypothetical protein [Grimontia kaedaensis]USH03684.1 hypothetical protein K6Q96_06740 [Grimontia kaedaensis]
MSSNKKSTSNLHSVEAEKKLEEPIKNDTQDRSDQYRNINQSESGSNENHKIIRLYMLFFILIFILTIVSILNQGLYRINEETLLVINQAFNALVILLIPFILGAIGGISRIIMSGLRVADEVSLIISSGLMAAFSWIGIKSGVLLAIVAPHMELKGFETYSVVQNPENFYTMALVAIFVGMFSTNLYLFINQRVESLTNQTKHDVADSSSKK